MGNLSVKTSHPYEILDDNCSTSVEKKVKSLIIGESNISVLACDLST